MALRLAMRSTPSARVSVRTAGKPSGIEATASATAKMSTWPIQGDGEGLDRHILCALDHPDRQIDHERKQQDIDERAAELTQEPLSHRGRPHFRRRVGSVPLEADRRFRGGEATAGQG